PWNSVCAVAGPAPMSASARARPSGRRANAPTANELVIEPPSDPGRSRTRVERKISLVPLIAPSRPSNPGSAHHTSVAQATRGGPQERVDVTRGRRRLGGERRPGRAREASARRDRREIHWPAPGPPIFRSKAVVRVRTLG